MAQPSLKTYGRGRSSNKPIPGGQLFAPATPLDTNDDENDIWATAPTASSSHTHKSAVLMDRSVNLHSRSLDESSLRTGLGASSVNKISSSSSSNSNNNEKGGGGVRVEKDGLKCGGKRSRCLQPAEVINASHPDDIVALSEAISKYQTNSQAHFGGPLFVSVPDCFSDSGRRFTSWLQQLGFQEGFLGPVWGLKYPRENVRNRGVHTMVWWCRYLQSSVCLCSDTDSH